MRHVTRKLADFIEDQDANLVLAPEARGFFFGLPAAVEADVAFAPVRKPGKLPREVIQESYDLEYGTDTLQMHADAIKPGDRVVIVDDLLATGGTVEAIRKMAENREPKWSVPPLWWNWMTCMAETGWEICRCCLWCITKENKTADCQPMPC